MATIVTGSVTPSGEEIQWFMGGAEATLIEAEELVTDASNNITLSKTAEFGSVFVVDADDVKPTVMLEMQTDGVTPATESSGTKTVTCAGVGDTLFAYYLDTETTDLVQVMSCQGVSSPRSIDTKETTIAGQVNKLQKTGASARTASLEKVSYNDDFIAAIFGDQHTASPAADQTKWIDKFTSVKKISALVGVQTVSGTIKRKYFLMGCQVTSMADEFPADDYFTEKMEFLVDYMVRVKL